jgi:hypothetical protein
MPPSKKSQGKQPKISAALNNKKKTKRTIASSDSDSEAESDGFVETPQKKPVGRPRKDARAPAPAPVVSVALFDPAHPLKAYSLTVEKRGGHLPLIMYTQICDWLDTRMELHSTSTEIGPKAGHMHLQNVSEGHMLTGIEGIKLFVKEIKNVCGVRHGDASGIAVCMKELVDGQTIQRMVGYTFKDRNLSTFRNRLKNVSQAMVDAGIAEHASLKLHYCDEKIMLTKANLFNKAYVKWMNEVTLGSI